MSRNDPRTYTWEIYQAKDGWRWRFVASNGRLIAESGEAYSDRSGVERALEGFDYAYQNAPQVIVG